MYQSFLNQANQMAGSTPFNPAMFGTAAPMTPEQTQAGNQVFNLGLTMGQFDPSQVQAIESPYTQDVVNATQNWFNNQNAIQGTGLMGQAIRSGNAFGGDRAGIAEAQLAGQQQMAQAPVIAGLEQAGYTQALGEYNQLKQMGLTGAEAALQWGNQQQAQAQRELDVQQQNAMMQQAYPFQLQNWYGSVLGGIGPLQGASSLGYTTPPPPSLVSQIGAIAGPLAGLAGAFFKRGGTVDRKLNGGLEHRGLVRIPGRFQDGGGLSESGGADAGPLYAGALSPSSNVNITSQNPSDPYGALTVGGRSMRTIPNVAGGGPRLPMRLPSWPSTQGQQQQAAATQQQTQQQKQQQAAQAVASTGGAALGLAGLGALALLKRGGAIPRFQDGGVDDYESEENNAPLGSGDDQQPIPLPPVTVAGAPVPTAASTDPTTSTTSPAPGWTSPNAPPSWLPGATAQPSTAPPAAGPRAGAVPVADGRGGYSTRHIPGLERPQRSFMQRWLSNPLTQMGAAMGASRSPYWSEALGRGFQAAGAAAEQQHKQDLLDATPKMITSGDTVQFLTGTGDLIDTGLKTTAGQRLGLAQEAQRQARLKTSPFFRGPPTGGPAGLFDEQQQQGWWTRDAEGNVRPYIPPGGATRPTTGPQGLGLPPIAAPSQPQQQSQAEQPGPPEPEQQAATPAQPAPKEQAAQAAAPAPVTPVAGIAQPPAAAQQQQNTSPWAAPEGEQEDEWNALWRTRRNEVPGAGAVINRDELPQRNEEVLQQATPNEAQTLKGLANYTIDPNSISMRQDARRKWIAAAQMYDPTYNPANYKLRTAAMKAFGVSGVEARNFQSNDMALQHLDRALTNEEELSKTHGSYQWLNDLRRKAQELPLIGGRDEKYQAALSAMKTDIDAVGNELMRTFRGSGSPSEKEAMRWRDNINEMDDPVKVRAALKEAALLLHGRVEAAGNRYNEAMGPGYVRSPESWLSRKARDALSRAETVRPEQPTPPGRSQGAPRPVAPTTQGGGGDRSAGWSRDRATGNYRGPDGRVYDPQGRPLQ
jgi:hypothetical protein